MKTHSVSNASRVGRNQHAPPPTLRDATPRHATPRHATPRHATPRHATPHLPRQVQRARAVGQKAAHHRQQREQRDHEDVQRGARQARWGSREAERRRARGAPRRRCFGAPDLVRPTAPRPGTPCGTPLPCALPPRRSTTWQSTRSLTSTQKPCGRRSTQSTSGSTPPSTTACTGAPPGRTAGRGLA
jgi:hypothetical protein